MKQRYYKAAASEEHSQAALNVLKNLQTYLLSRFAIVIIVIYFGDQLVTLFLQGTVFYFMQHTLEMNSLNISSGSFGSLFTLFAAGFLNMVSMIFPGFIGTAMRSVIPSVVGITIDIPDAFEVLGPLGTSFYMLLVMGSVILALILSLIPYLIAGIWYARLVYHRVNTLLQLDHDAAREREQQRNLMLSDIAHDIKTPITSVCGYANALSDHLVPEEKVPEYLDTIYRKSMRISELINMLFEYVKMDSSGFTLMRSEADLAELVLENTALIYTDMEEAGLTLDVDIPEEEMRALIDKGQMSRVVTNLLSNAVKYLNSGNSVLVKMEHDEKEITVIVADDGDPIDDTLAEHIFEPFSRGDKTRSTKGGSGLGLSIASKVVMLHEGTLLLDNEYPAPYHKAFIIKMPELPRQ